MDRTQFGNYVRVAGPAPVAVANLYQAPVTETFGISNSMHANIIVSNWFKEKRGTAISLSLTGIGFGGVIFSQVVTWLINNVGWRQTYMIYGAIILVVFQ